MAYTKTSWTETTPINVTNLNKIEQGIADAQSTADSKEPSFTKNTAFNKNFGTTSGTVAEGNHTHSYLPLGGGTLSGDINMNSNTIAFSGSGTNYDHIWYDDSTVDGNPGAFHFVADASRKAIGNATVIANAFRGRLIGNSDTSSKWATSRTLSLSGDASGSVNWDGSANATLSVTVSDDSHNHVISNVDGLQTALNGKSDTGHSHDYQQHKLTDGTLARSASTDWNNYSDTGYYMGSSLLNETGGSSWRYMQSIKHNSIWNVQIMNDFQGTTMGFRAKANDVWQPWRMIWHDGNFDPSTKAEVGHTHSYDNYNGWDLQVNTGTANRITSGENVNFIAGSNVSISQSGTDITISSTDTNTNTQRTDEEIRDVIGVALKGSGATSVTVDDANNTITISSTDTNTDTTYTAGGGLSLSGTQFSHLDTSSQGSSSNSGRTYIQSVTLDTYGHVTGLTTASETVTNTDTNYYLNGVSGSGNGTVTFDMIGRTDITWDASHTHNYDNYNGWDLQVNSGTANRITTGENVNFVAGDNVTLSQSGTTITISSTDTNTDTNTQRTDEEIRDVIGTALRGGGATTVTVDDAANTITISSTDTDTNTWRPIHDSPVDGATTTSISSNWAHDITGVINNKADGVHNHDTDYLGISANAVSASKWSSSRTITLSGDVSGSVSIDGSSNVTLSTVVSDDSHNHTIANVDGLQTTLDGKSDSGHTHSDMATQTWVKGFGVGDYAVVYNGDLNTLTTPGFYYASSDATNKPGTTNYHLLVQAVNSNYATQILSRGGGTRGLAFIRYLEGGTWTPWYSVDGVAEEGSNSNGHYIRCENGTQICYWQGSATTNTLSAYGGSYRSDSDITWNYPAVFTSDPSVFIQIEQSEVFLTYCNNIISTACTYRAMSPKAWSDVYIPHKRYAIGRWK